MSEQSEVESELSDEELEFLQVLLDHKDSTTKEKNYARWAINALTNPKVLKAERNKSNVGKSIWYSLGLGVLLIALGMMFETLAAFAAGACSINMLYMIAAIVMYLAIKPPRNGVTLEDGSFRCTYCDALIEKDSFIKSLFAKQPPLDRHWDETGHMRELADTSAEMQGEDLSLGMRIKLNILEK